MTAKLTIKSSKQIERLERSISKAKLARARRQNKKLEQVFERHAKPVGRPRKIHPDRENQFLQLFLTKSKYQPERQFMFHPTRRWRLDFAWPRERVAVEIDGGIFQRKVIGKDGQVKDGQTGHRSIQGLMDGMEKTNQAQIHGWLLLRYHARDLDKRPMQVFQEVLGMIEIRSRMVTEKDGGGE